MGPKDFTRDAPGRVVRSVQGNWTFLPDPLPPELTFTAELVQLTADASLALGELNGAGRMLPNPHLLMRPFIRREAVLSSKIEGTITGLDQLFLFEAEPEHLSHPSDAGEVRNYVLALEHGLEAIRAGKPFTLQLIREVHRLLLTDVRGADKRPGELRDVPVLIGKNFDFDEARFVPPCHLEVRRLLDDLVRFVRSEPKLPVVVLLALLHYQFETIHPFNDGNGRVGRLLITLMLCERKALSQPLLYLSAYFEKRRQAYYDCLLNTSLKAQWSAWIAFFAEGVAEQARDAALRTHKLLELRDRFRHRAAGVARSANALNLVDEFFAAPYLTIKQAAEHMKVTFAAAQRTIEKLQGAKLLREITGNQRNRVYCADEVLRHLDAPLEELPKAKK